MLESKLAWPLPGRVPNRFGTGVGAPVWFVHRRPNNTAELTIEIISIGAARLKLPCLIKAWYMPRLADVHGST